MTPADFIVILQNAVTQEQALQVTVQAQVDAANADIATQDATLAAAQATHDSAVANDNTTVASGTATITTIQGIVDYLNAEIAKLQAG